jgi:hypothetical protein
MRLKINRSIVLSIIFFTAALVYEVAMRWSITSVGLNDGGEPREGQDAPSSEGRGRSWSAGQAESGKHSYDG